MDGGRPREILDDGGREWAAGPWLAAGLSRHRRAVAGLVVVAVLATAIVVASGRRGPPLPALFVSGDGFLQEPAWAPRADGRPGGPAIASFVALVSRRSESSTAATVLGISGPGVVRMDSLPVPLLNEIGDREVALRPVLDCDIVAEVAPERYPLAVRVEESGRVRTGFVDAGATGVAWASTARAICVRWLARRDLIVTAAPARAHPIKTGVDVTLTVANRGGHPGVVGAENADPSIRLTGPLPLQIPPHSSASAAVTMSLDRCDDIVSLPANGSPDGFVMSMLGLVGGVGASPRVRPEDVGDEEVALRIDRSAQESLIAALHAACGGLRPMGTRIEPGGINVDVDRRILTVDLRILVTPGVRSLRLRPLPPAGDPGEYLPLWGRTGALTPNRTDEVGVVLRYRVPERDACPTRGGFVWGFDAVLQVPDQGGERTITLQHYPNMLEDPAVVDALCA
jgi:hypothetical protein